MQGNVCVGAPPTMVCASGGSYDSTAKSCVRRTCIFSCSTTYYQPTPSCSEYNSYGFSYNPETGRCERRPSPSCPQGTYLDYTYSQCEVPATPTCADGFTLNTQTSPAVCQAPPLRGRSTADQATGDACPDDSPNSTGTPPNCGKGRGGSV